MPSPRLRRAFTGLIILVLVKAAGCAPKETSFDDAWIPAAPPNVRTLAGYLEIHNGLDTPMVIAKAESTHFREVAFHRTEAAGEILHMIAVPELEISPGETLSLEPGGYHLMLIEPLEPLGVDDTVGISLSTSDGRRFDVTFTVRSMDFTL